MTEISETAREIGARLARQIFERRGNHDEAHLCEAELAAYLMLAADLGAGRAPGSTAKPSREEFVAMVRAQWPTARLEFQDRGLLVQPAAAGAAVAIRELAIARGLVLQGGPVFRIFGFKRIPSTSPFPPSAIRAFNNRHED